MKLVTTILALGLLVAAAPAFGAASAPTDHEQLAVEAKQAYKDQNFDRAEERFVDAIQVAPDESTYYRDLARTYFKKSEYAAAVAYYDVYLRQEPDADDKERIQKERAYASHQGGGEAWELPRSQRMAREALEEQLDTGSAYTSGGGGAWALYQTLLRTGYAQPDLARIRHRLMRRLLEEFEGALVADSGQPTPQLDLDDWQTQRERLEAAETLVDDEAMVEMLDRRQRIVDAGLALLNRQGDKAVSKARAAVEQNPDIGFVRWFEVVGLVETGAHDDALDALDTLESDLEASAPKLLGYARIMRASILQRMGRDDEAADIYLELFSE